MTLWHLDLKQQSETRLREYARDIVKLAAPKPAFAEWLMREMSRPKPEGFWRDAGHGVEQWVTPR